jgi:hypothetical protein
VVASGKRVRFAPMNCQLLMEKCLRTTSRLGGESVPSVLLP